MMLLFSPCKRCPCPCSDAVLRSCEEALAGIILHRPPSLWFAWVRSGCAGPLAGSRGGPAARGPEGLVSVLPPLPMALACQVGSCLVWPCCFLRLVLFGLVPSPPVEWGLWSFWLAPPRLWGAVCSTEVWYGCCHLLVVMSSLRALSPPPLWGTKYDFALFSLQTLRPVPALMRFSAPVKKHCLGSFSIVLPPSGLRGFVPVVRDCWEQGPPAAGGPRLRGSTPLPPSMVYGPGFPPSCGMECGFPLPPVKIIAGVSGFWV